MFGKMENLYKKKYVKIAKTILTSAGKRYYLLDEIPRTKLQAQKLAIEIREKGKVAFTRPITDGYQITCYFVYEAEKFRSNLN